MIATVMKTHFTNATSSTWRSHYYTRDTWTERVVFRWPRWTKCTD